MDESNVQMDNFDCDNACDPSGGEIHVKFVTKGINQCPCENAEQFLHKPEGLLHNLMECHEQFMEQTFISIPGLMCLDKNAALAQHNVLHTGQKLNLNCNLFHVLSYSAQEKTQPSACDNIDNVILPSGGDYFIEIHPPEVSEVSSPLVGRITPVSEDKTKPDHADDVDARTCQICGMTFMLETACLCHMQHVSQNALCMEYAGNFKTSPGDVNDNLSVPIPDIIPMKGVMTNIQPPEGEAALTVMFPTPANPAPSFGGYSHDVMHLGCKMKHFYNESQRTCGVQNNCLKCKKNFPSVKRLEDNSRQHTRKISHCSDYGKSSVDYGVTHLRLPG